MEREARAVVGLNTLHAGPDAAGCRRGFARIRGFGRPTAGSAAEFARSVLRQNALDFADALFVRAGVDQHRSS
jgi:hypothetical protein